MIDEHEPLYDMLFRLIEKYERYNLKFIFYQCVSYVFFSAPYILLCNKFIHELCMGNMKNRYNG